MLSVKIQSIKPFFASYNMNMPLIINV